MKEEILPSWIFPALTKEIRRYFTLKHNPNPFLPDDSTVIELTSAEKYAKEYPEFPELRFFNDEDWPWNLFPLTSEDDFVAPYKVDLKKKKITCIEQEVPGYNPGDTDPFDSFNFEYIKKYTTKDIRFLIFDCYNNLTFFKDVYQFL